MLGFACQVGEGVFPQIAPCLEHVCAGGGGGSVAFEGLLYICRTGLWFAPLMYVACIEIGGHWSCALAHWNRTAEYSPRIRRVRG